jgi:hypothetical protein
MLTSIRNALLLKGTLLENDDAGTTSAGSSLIFQILSPADLHWPPKMRWHVSPRRLEQTRQPNTSLLISGLFTLLPDLSTPLALPLRLDHLPILLPRSLAPHQTRHPQLLHQLLRRPPRLVCPIRDPAPTRRKMDRVDYVRGEASVRVEAIVRKSPRRKVMREASSGPY